VTAWTRRLRAFFGIEYALMLTYRAEILLWAVATCLPLIMLGVWSQAAASGDFVHGPAWMARYFIAVFLVRQVTIVWVIHHFEYLVVSGRLSPQLLLPVDPVWRYAVAHLAEQACRLPIVAVMLGVHGRVYPALRLAVHLWALRVLGRAGQRGPRAGVPLDLVFVGHGGAAGSLARGRA